MTCLVIALLVVASGCSDEDNLTQPTPPPSIPALTLDQLYAAPDSLIGMKLYEEPGLGRDFMPFSPPEGLPLVAGIFLIATPPDSFPASVSDVYLWVIRDSSEVWSKTMVFELIDEARGGAHFYVARGGPLWGPDILVDVVIGVRTSPTNVALVLVRGVPIIRVA